MDPQTRKRRAAILRYARKIHRTTGAILFGFFFIVAITGLLLGWKKHTGGAILADTAKGRSAKPEDWLAMPVLRDNAQNVFRNQISSEISPAIDRIDMRPEKGIAKFIFVEGYWGIQMDLTTGEPLTIERRRSDFIENVHDGVILDNLLGTSGEQIKLVYTSVMGLALLTFTITGFWLWLGPKQFKGRRTGHQR
ncbi:MAG: PepSY-associated TM helix domain-containing protein [Pyrinomonadaceae bacterium]